MPTDAAKQVVRRAWEELEGYLEEQGLELVEVEFSGGGNRAQLRLFIDKEGGVTLDDCAAASQVLGPVLDSCDFIESSYTLEVSSPGIDRPMRKPGDFERYIGESVTIRTDAAVGGRRKFKGVLTGYDQGLIEMDCDGGKQQIHIDNVAKARLNR